MSGKSICEAQRSDAMHYARCGSQCVARSSMRCALRCALRRAIPLALFLLLACTGCAKKSGDAWVSPADDASLAKLESETLGPGISRERRARLFFLWGQELAAKSADEAAIGAFERVVDLDSVLVSESRFNLEILWRRQNEQKKQDQQDQQNDKDTKSGQDSQSGKDQQKADDNKNADQKSGEQKQQSGSSSKNDSARAGSDASKPKDLSSLVRDKEQSSDLDKALKAELDRRNEKQNAEAGSIVPVEKDW